MLVRVRLLKRLAHPATAYAAVASTVSRWEEVQGATAPIQVFLIVGYVAVYVLRLGAPVRLRDALRGR